MITVLLLTDGNDLREVDQINDSDLVSIFNFESNQGDPISNCLGVELFRVKSCRQEFKKVSITQGNWIVVVLFCGKSTVEFCRCAFFMVNAKG